MRLTLVLVLTLSHLTWPQILCQPQANNDAFERLLMISQIVRSPEDQVRNVDELRSLLHEGRQLFSSVMMNQINMATYTRRRGDTIAAYAPIRQLLAISEPNNDCQASTLQLAHKFVNGMLWPLNNVVRNYVRQASLELVDRCFNHIDQIIERIVGHLHEDVKASIEQLDLYIKTHITLPTQYPQSTVERIAKALFQFLRLQGENIERDQYESAISHKERVRSIILTKISTPCQLLHTNLNGIRTRYGMCLRLKEPDQIVIPTVAIWMNRVQLCHQIMTKTEQVFWLGYYDFLQLKKDIFSTEIGIREPTEMRLQLQAYSNFLASDTNQRNYVEEKRVADDLLTVTSLKPDNCTKNFFRVTLGVIHRKFINHHNLNAFLRYYGARQVEICIPTFLTVFERQLSKIDHGLQNVALQFASNADRLGLARVIRLTRERVVEIVRTYFGLMGLQILEPEMIFEHRPDKDQNVAMLAEACLAFDTNMTSVYQFYHNMMSFNEDPRLEEPNLSLVMLATNICRRLVEVTDYHPTYSGQRRPFERVDIVISDDSDSREGENQQNALSPNEFLSLGLSSSFANPSRGQQNVTSITAPQEAGPSNQVSRNVRARLNDENIAREQDDQSDPALTLKLGFD